MVLEIPNKFEPLFEWLQYKRGGEDETKPPFSVAILTGGRNSFKSFTASVMLAEAVSSYSHRILYTRYTMTSTEDSVIPEFKEKLDLLNYGDRFNINKDRIIYKEGEKEESETTPKVVFKGIKTSAGNQTANLKSLKGFSIFVLEEAEEMPSFSEWDKIRKSIRAKDVFNLCILILNPTTKEHWVHKEFFEERGIPDGWNGVKDGVCYIHTTYKDGQRDWTADHIMEDFEKTEEAYHQYLSTPIKERDALPEKIKKWHNYYAHSVLGGWLDKAEGVVFTDWVIGPYEEINSTLHGQDFGFSVDPTTLVSASIDKARKKIYLREELYKTHLTTTDIYEANKRVAGTRKVYADSAEPRLIEELRKRGNNIEAVEKGQGSVSAGIALMQDYQLVIDPGSINLIKELNNYVWSDKKSGVPVDAYNHLIDACRYACYKELKTSRNVDLKKLGRMLG